MRSAFTIGAIALTALTGAVAAEPTLDYYLPGGVTYDPAVPTPRSVLGYEVGEWHARHDQLVSYARAVADASDRVQLEEIGRTHEGRPLLVLTISSAENLDRLEEIRQEHLQLSDPTTTAPDPTAMPVVVYLGYSVHGNESSGSNAAMLIAYYLAAAQGERADELLGNSVVLLDPCLNPDGLSRFSQWANMYRGKHPNGDPNHREHAEAWPGGRTNHYWFDLNRDWLLLQQPESRARVAVFHDWRPNLLADFHEMGSNATYFFQPGVPSRQNPLTPSENVSLTQRIAGYHARTFDAAGVLYYSEEVFDDFYYGKGSTYPDVNGCVGILFEQASSRGHLRESVNGEFDFAFTIRNQCLTSFSTLDAALDNRVDLLSYQRSFYESATDLAGDDPVKGYVFGDTTDTVRNARLLEVLRGHAIEVHELARPLSMDEQTFEPGSAWVVSLDQPQYRLARTLFEEPTTFQDSLFYDVSAWTLPPAMGVPHAELSRVRDRDLGPAVDVPATPRGRQPSAPATYAYAFSWGGYYAPRALNRLLELGARVRVATRPFTATTDAGDTDFGYGSIVVPLGIQDVEPSSVHDTMWRISEEDAVDVYALSTGLTPEGIDLGSPDLRPVTRPSALLVVGSGTSSYEAGEVWHLLDHRFDMSLTLVDRSRLRTLDLDEYTHVILVSGRYGTAEDGGAARLREWVETGGVLIALKRAVRWVTEQGLAPVTLRDGEWAAATDTTAGADSAWVPPPPERIPYVEHRRRKGATRIGGTIFAARIDVTHPIGYGYVRPRLAVFRNTDLFLEPSQNPYATVVQYEAEPLISGYVSDENLAKVAGSASVIADRVGGGTIVLMVDDPNFRATWLGTSKLFLNALFFGSVIDRTE